MLVAVAQEDERATTVGLLETIGVEPRLLLALVGAAPGALGLDHTERTTVFSPQHVVDEALAGVVGHALHGELAVALLVEGPAGLLEQHVDERVAGRGFGIVVRVGASGVGGLGLRQLLAHRGQLVFDLRLAGLQLGELGLELLELIGRLPRSRRRLWPGQ